MIGRGARGRQLALLAVLATARDRAIARDKLLATLWPEASLDRARSLLSDAVYRVRNTIGDDAIIATGDELRLNVERVASDVDAFERLLGEKQWECAVAEYAGPFLDGFHVTEAAEFERWVDGERARLADGFANALSALAAANEEARDWSAAVTWLRRLATHDPYAGRVALRLMRALNAAGNRAGALQHARVHATLLREEFGAEPDPEVAEFADQLKSEPFPSSPSSGLPPRLTAEVREEAVDSQPPYPSLATSSSGDADPPVAPADDQSRVRPPSADRWYTSRRARVALLVVGVVVVGSVLASWRGDESRQSMLSTSARPSSLAPQRSIAVLPFDDIGPGRDDSYFSDGLTEEIIALLGRVNGLRVAARTSSFALRDARLEARGLGDTLRVATLLEGSVRREGDRVRVTAQLVDVANGYQLWSKSYDRRVQDVIALQNDIASAIVAALQLQLERSETTRAPRSPHNPEAYDLYLRGAHARNKLTGEELAKAIDYFDRAIRLDSTYAPAYAGKATTLGPMVWHGRLPRAQGTPLMEAAARRAVQLDDALPESHVALGMFAFFFQWDWPTAEREFRRAMELNPNDSHAHHFLANYLRAMGRFDEAITERTRAVELDPLSVRMGMMLGTDYLLAGKYELAAQAFRRASEIEPRSPIALGLGPARGFQSMGLGHVYESQGKFEAAVREYVKVDSLAGVMPDELALRRRAFATDGIRGYWRRLAEQLEQDRSASADATHLAWMWARAGDTERTIRSLERAHRDRSIALVYLGVLPEFAAARTDSRVVAILEAMRLRPVGRETR